MVSSDKNTNDVEIVEISKEQTEAITEKSNVDNDTIEALESNMQFVEVGNEEETDSGFNAEDNDEFEIIEVDADEDPLAETNETTVSWNLQKMWKLLDNQ